MMKHGEDRDNVSPPPAPPAGDHRYPTDRRDGTARTSPAPGSYREIAPPDRLRDHVICFWCRAPGRQPSVTSIIPDGCIDIVWRSGSPPGIAGPMTEPIRTRLEPGDGVVGIRFQPGAASQILGIEARELRDRHVPLWDLWSPREFASWVAITPEGPLPDTIVAMTEAISHRLRQACPLDPFVVKATRWMADHPFGPIDALCQLSGLGARQVRRRFDLAVGYGPKTLQRVLRLQYLLWLAGQRSATERCLATLAIASGYADQPHMTREVVALTGASPRQILLTATPQSAVSGLFLAKPNRLTVPAFDRELG